MSTVPISQVENLEAETLKNNLHARGASQEICGAGRGNLVSRLRVSWCIAQQPVLLPTVGWKFCSVDCM